MPKRNPYLISKFDPFRNLFTYTSNHMSHFFRRAATSTSRRVRTALNTRPASSKFSRTNVTTAPTVKDASQTTKSTFTKQQRAQMLVSNSVMIIWFRKLTYSGFAWRDKRITNKCVLVHFIFYFWLSEDNCFANITFGWFDCITFDSRTNYFWWWRWDVSVSPLFNLVCIISTWYTLCKLSFPFNNYFAIINFAF